MTMDRSTFLTLYQRTAPAVRARCRAMCGNDADADEVLQDAYLRAWNARDRFDGRHPLAWLHTIARNAALDLIRRRKPWRDDPEVWLQLAAPAGSPTAGMEISRMLESFSPEDAALLRMRHAEQWRVHELAEHFDTSARTLRRRLERLEARARSVLRLPQEASHGT